MYLSQYLTVVLVFPLSDEHLNNFKMEEKISGEVIQSMVSRSQERPLIRVEKLPAYSPLTVQTQTFLPQVFPVASL